MSKLLSKGRSLSIVHVGALFITVASGCADAGGTMLEDKGLPSMADPTPVVAIPDAGALIHVPVTEADAARPASDVDAAHDAHVEATHDASVDPSPGHDADVGAVADAGPPPAPGSFASVYPIFAANCVSCHGAGKPLDLSSPTTAYAALVGVPASMKACGATDGGVAPTRVVAGDPDNSLLIHKLEGTQSCGKQMPITLLLPQETVDIVQAWVSAGAPAP